MSGGPSLGGREFRRDIQGLRAVAVVLVLVYHLWPETVTAGFVGVDVFFVISGFLITAHLLQHPPRSPRDLLEFWGRRIRRLLPAAFLVLLATAIASRIVAPETRWAQTAIEIMASALYVVNWLLAATSVDYLAAAEPPTPVQHYWSLAVEEQFYLVWPVLILATFWVARGVQTAGARLGGVTATRVVMAGVVAASLLFSINATAAEPANAYFITPTRVWELAAGGVVATLPSLAAARRSRQLVDGAAWAGLGMLLVAAFVYSPDTPFPGSAAVLPVLGAALVLLAASEGSRSPTRLLGLRPIQHLGDTSYSIYLWHWPLIVLWPYALGPIDTAGSLAIVALTLALATLTKIFVEDAYRFSPKFQPLRPTFRFAAVGMLVVSIVGGAQLFEAQLRLDAALAAAPELPLEPGVDATSAPGSTTAPTGPVASLAPGATPGPSGAPSTPAITSCLGAAAIVRGFAACPQDPAGKLVPDPVAAHADKSAAYRDGCWNYAPFETRITCRYGTGAVQVALVGNSHAGHWLPALQVLAKQHGWTITTYLASQCNATDARLEFFSASKSTGCLTYGDWVHEQTRGSAYDLVIMSERQSVRTEGDTWDGTLERALAGYESFLRGWSDAGTNVLVIQDTPFPGKALGTIPDCLAANRSNHQACDGTPQSWSWLDPLYDAATRLQLPGITTLATHRFVCTETACHAAIGTVVTYFDGSHITATYARTLAPFFEPEILAALERG